MKFAGVVVLAVMVGQILPGEHEVRLELGTGKTFQYLAVHQTSSCLEPEKSHVPAMFPALN